MLGLGCVRVGWGESVSIIAFSVEIGGGGGEDKQERIGCCQGKFRKNVKRMSF